MNTHNGDSTMQKDQPINLNSIVKRINLIEGKINLILMNMFKIGSSTTLHSEWVENGKKTKDPKRI